MNNSKRKRFKRSACYSSQGEYVKKSHEQYIREQHQKNENVLLTINIRLPRRYFVKCFGKLVEITYREAMMLGKANIIIK